jgi:hypothetical protein
MSDAKTILDDIARELEGAGYVHMCNGPGIKSILAEHEAMQAKYNAAVAAVGGFITPTGGDLAEAIKLLAKPASVPAGGDTVRERGWLIELKGATPSWAILNPRDYDEHWTADSTKAIRFAREADAQAYIDHIGWTEAFPSEHIWDALREAFDALRFRMLTTALGENEPVMHVFDRCVEAHLASLQSTTAGKEKP